MRKLVIVESPSKAKTIEKYLGKEYQVISSKGHIRDLPADELGVDVEHGYKPKFATLKGKEKVVQEIQKEAAGKSVLLASDMDREGEAIAWHLSQILNLDEKETNRVIFSEITEKAIKAAIKKPLPINKAKVEAQFARRILDRLVGYKISPFLWKIIQLKSLSAGRVQSVALRFLCEQEEKIIQFVPEEYWKFKADFEGLETLLLSIEGVSLEKKPIKTQKDAEVVEKKINQSAFTVLSVEEKTVSRKPPTPFITSTLQQEASTRLGFSVSRTMKIAQELYEGVETTEGATAFITYMRTDSTRLSEEALESAKNYITARFGEDHSKVQQYLSKKANTQDAHEAIRPTYSEIDPEKAHELLTPDQAKLYQLIWSRFIASQMVSARYFQTKIKIQDTDKLFIFEADGSICSFEGYEKVYPPTAKEKPLDFRKKAGETIEISKLEKSRNFTIPPPRFNEASLVKKLEKEGIGRPSTYAAIIHTLIEREYAYRELKNLIPTFLGMLVNHFLVSFFPRIIQTKFTATLEERLDGVEEGVEDWQKTIDTFYTDFEPTLVKIQKEIVAKSFNWEFKTNQKCAECGQELQLKMGRFGPYLHSEECKKNYTIAEKTKILFKEGVAEISDNQQVEGKKEEASVGRKCPKCDSELIERTGKYGRFIACSNYPKCKYTENIDVFARGKCPKCDAPVTQRMSKKARIFYSCKNSTYNGGNCDFFSWYEPAENKCKTCGQTLFIKKPKNSEETEFCMYCEKKNTSGKKKTK